MIYRMDLIEKFDDNVFISIYDALEHIKKTVIFYLGFQFIR